MNAISTTGIYGFEAFIKRLWYKIRKQELNKDKIAEYELC